ncbi:MAG: hypothetical protein Q8877_03350, partial [Sweet potato little leaf phytoplasma]|nr:hypothetical protein [Sweet potato little leaf phytoplasma]
NNLQKDLVFYQNIEKNLNNKINLFQSQINQDHPGENPGANLVPTQLKGANYHSWSRSMKRALLSKNKFKFVDGSLPMPSPEDELYDAWERCNVMVISWITRSVSEQIAQSTIYIDSAQELWHDLKDRFSKGDYFKTSDLLQEIHSSNKVIETSLDSSRI